MITLEGFMIKFLENSNPHVYHNYDLCRKAVKIRSSGIVICNCGFEFPEEITVLLEIKSGVSREEWL